MKVYTRTGDKGITSLYDGKRIAKNSLFFEVLGEIDELSSRIGVLCASLTGATLSVEPIQQLRVIQGILQDINSIIATVDPNGRTLPFVTADDITKIETFIDTMEGSNPKLTKFILPGVTISDSHAHMCRTQTRKVERRLWEMHNSNEYVEIFKVSGQDSYIDLSEVEIHEHIFKYVNRLSDYFFVLARYICHTVHGKEDHFC